MNNRRHRNEIITKQSTIHNRNRQHCGHTFSQHYKEYQMSSYSNHYLPPTPPHYIPLNTRNALGTKWQQYLRLPLHYPCRKNTHTHTIHTHTLYTHTHYTHTHTIHTHTLYTHYTHTHTTHTHTLYTDTALYKMKQFNIQSMQETLSYQYNPDMQRSVPII